MRKPTINGTVQKAVRKASRLEYAALRMPLAVLDERLLPRVPGGSKLQGVVGRGISALDSVAGRGGHRVEAEPIPAEEVEQRAEILLEEQEQHPLAGELAEDDELRRVQAELRAKHAVEAAHETDH